MALVLATLLGAVVSLVAAETIDPVNTQAQYAWGENIGWINAEPSGNGGPGVTVSGLKLTGYMWSENAGWINLNCSNNALCTPANKNWGVYNNGVGLLTGYAWAENLGWISFSCQNKQSTCAGTGNYGVTIDPVTGVFSGKAWSENAGWIVFDYTVPGGNPAPCVQPLACRVKTADDGDGIAWPADNCPFDNAVSQVNTDKTNNTAQTNLPGADEAGDPCDDDKDGDGYTTAQEAAVGKSDLSYCQIMRADVDNDGAVSILDLTKVAQKFTQTLVGSDLRLNLDFATSVSILDLTKMAQVFIKHTTDCVS